jgi:hypothetical protein
MPALPQVLLHELHSDHALSRQSTGHTAGPQEDDTLVSSGQLLPPDAGWECTVRWRVCRPLPHVAVHRPHADHSDTTQSTAQACVLQATLSVSLPQRAPPHAAAKATARTLMVVPAPHTAEQSPLGPQSVVTQSTGGSAAAQWHAAVLQGAVSDRAAQGWPPAAAALPTARVRSLVPPPQ